MASDNTIPLSPQWLISKSGDNKPPPLSMVSDMFLIIITSVKDFVVLVLNVK